MSINLSRCLPALSRHLRDLRDNRCHRLAALVVDLFGSDFFDAALEFGIKPYLFFPTTALCLSLFLNLPLLDVQVSCEFRDMREPIRLPGCTPIHGKYLLDPVQDRANDAYRWILHHAKRYNLAEGIMINTFNELEEGALEFLTMHEPGKPLVYPVGPLVRTRSSDDEVDGSECLKWLDNQPSGSVLFVSFGSAGTHSHDQIIELAHGLEMSEQRFLWVLRGPFDWNPSEAFFNYVGDKNKPLEYLPKGFLERTKERGLVIPMWAPQVKVLNHEATGGFMSHCGWNSTLESVVSGVPLIAWPLYAEQKMNAEMLSNGMKVALKPNPNEKGLFDRDEIASVVKALMEGEEGKKMRGRMEALKVAAIRAVEEEGSSTKALLQVTQKWISS